MLTAIAGCNQRPILVTPKIIVVLNVKGAVVTPSIGSEESSAINLPVCDLAACTSTREDCAASTLDRLVATGSPVWSYFSKKPDTLYTIATHGYYTSMNRKVSLQRIVEKWPELGCVRGLRETDASGPRLRECIRHMPDWTIKVNKAAVSELLSNADYRRVCLRDQL